MGVREQPEVLKAIAKVLAPFFEAALQDTRQLVLEHGAYRIRPWAAAQVSVTLLSLTLFQIDARCVCLFLSLCTSLVAGTWWTAEALTHTLASHRTRSGIATMG